MTSDASRNLVLSGLLAPNDNDTGNGNGNAQSGTATTTTQLDGRHLCVSYRATIRQRRSEVEPGRRWPSEHVTRMLHALVIVARGHLPRGCPFLKCAGILQALFGRPVIGGDMIRPARARLERTAFEAVMWPVLIVALLEDDPKRLR